MSKLLGSQPFVLEVVPPPLRLGPVAVERVLERVATIHEAVSLDAVNVPEIREESSRSDQGRRRNPYEPRVSPRELAACIADRVGVPPIVNRVVAHHTEAELTRWFLETHERYGISNFVLVGGEHVEVEYPGPSVVRANQLIREVLPGSGLVVGNICIPGRSVDIPEWRRVEAKVEAGADLFSSQVVYHAEEMQELLAGLQECSELTRQTVLLLSVCPLRSARSVDFLRFLGVHIEDELATRLVDADPAATLERTVEHLVEMWGVIQDYRRAHAPGNIIGANLAPIGKVPLATTIELARRLRERTPQSG